MTEREWLQATDPAPMFRLVSDLATDRKLRLLACACCRHIWPLLKDEEARHAVGMAELYADGLIERDSLIRAAKALLLPEWPGSGPKTFNWRPVTKGIAADMTDPRTYVWLTAEAGVTELTSGLVAAKWMEDGARFVSSQIQVGLLHELFGNPFCPISLDPSWLTPDAVALAQAAYENRSLPSGTLDNDRLAVLGDALEEAGCTAAALFNHLRGPGTHYRGCWLVDALLAKE
jgi:hypothetical protein